MQTDEIKLEVAVEEAAPTDAVVKEPAAEVVEPVIVDNSAADSKLYNSLEAKGGTGTVSVRDFLNCVPKENLLRFDLYTTFCREKLSKADDDDTLDLTEFGQLMDYVRVLNQAEAVDAKDAGMTTAAYSAMSITFYTLSKQSGEDGTQLTLRQAHTQVGSAPKSSITEWQKQRNIENIKKWNIHDLDTKMDVKTFAQFADNNVKIQKAASATWKVEAAKHELSVAKYETYVATFRGFDLDGDNSVTVQEIMDYFVETGVDIGDNRKDSIRQIFTEVDKDTSGDMDFEEFVQFMKKIDALNLQEAQQRETAFRETAVATTPAVSDEVVASAYGGYLCLFLVFNLPFVIPALIFLDEYNDECKAQQFPEFLTGWLIILVLQFLGGFGTIHLVLAGEKGMSALISALFSLGHFGLSIWGAFMIFDVAKQDKTCKNSDMYVMVWFVIVFYGVFGIKNGFKNRD